MTTPNRSPTKNKKRDLTLTSSWRRSVEAVELKEMLHCEQKTIRQRKPPPPRLGFRTLRGYYGVTAERAENNKNQQATRRF